MSRSVAFSRLRAVCGRAHRGPAILLLLLPYSFSALAWAPSFAGHNPEVGTPSVEPGSVGLWNGTLVAEIEAGLQYLVLTEDDMNDTYGSLPVLGMRISKQVSPVAQFFLGTGYGHAGGDPYYDQADFLSEDEASLHVIPLQMGLRANLTPAARFRLNLGFVLEMTWIRETLPASYYQQDELGRTFTESGWTRGVGATFGPEWRLADPTAAFGLEAIVTGNSGDIGRDPDHQVNLSGMGARLYFTTGL